MKAKWALAALLLAGCQADDDRAAAVGETAEEAYLAATAHAHVDDARSLRRLLPSSRRSRFSRRRWLTARLAIAT